MNRIQKSVLATLVLSVLAVAAGCSKADDHAGHDHAEGDGHDHAADKAK